MLIEDFNAWSTETLRQHPDGLISGMTEEIYNAAPGIRSSTIKHPTTKEMRHSMLKPMKATYATRLGTLVHTLTLENIGGATDISDICYVIKSKGINTIEAKEAEKEYPNHLIVTKEMLIKAECMRDAIMEHSLAAKLLNCRGRREVSAFAWDDETQVMRKARLDMLPEGANYLLDIKTCDDVTELGFWRSIGNWGWNVSQAYYMDILKQLEGKRRDYCYLIGVTGPKAESQSPDDEPYMANVFEINSPWNPDKPAPENPEENLIFQGGNIYRNKLAKFANALRTNTFEAYEHETEPTYLTSRRPFS